MDLPAPKPAVLRSARPSPPPPSSLPPDEDASWNGTLPSIIAAVRFGDEDEDHSRPSTMVEDRGQRGSESARDRDWSDKEQQVEEVEENTSYEPLQYFHRPFRPLSAAGSRSSTERPRSATSNAPKGATAAAVAEAQPVSFVDLLSMPYPQPAPGQQPGAPPVGSNLALLSHLQTFEMYLANVNKTHDLAAQYEFAVFMFGASQSADADPKAPVSKKRLVTESRAIMQRLADKRYAHAQYFLGDGLASGAFAGGRPALDKALALFVAASKQGHVEATYRAALAYEFGWGTSRERAKAAQYYRQAASKNHPGAMLRLALACLDGELGQSGAPARRYREGLSWLRRAVDDADAQYNAAPYHLGRLHIAGFGPDVFADQPYAAQLFTRAAELGHAQANYELGSAYEHGDISCPRDAALSLHFYTTAAQFGHLDAMFALCAWYLVGAPPILDKDDAEAYEWARRAADAGMPKAMYTVGYFTEMGIGIRRDPLEANLWYSRAADHGDVRARQRIAAINAAASGGDEAAVAEAAALAAEEQPQKKKKRFGVF